MIMDNRDFRASTKLGDLKIIIEIDCSGDAFYCDPLTEILRAVDRAAHDAYHAAQRCALDTESVLFDSNGNRCGSVRNSWGER